MAQWTAPFHAPKFTDEEFEAQKKAYTDKHGYTVTIPTFSDIIHLRAFEPLTAEETAAWSAKEYDKIPPGRRADIRKEKARKKAKYLAMLADPSPKIARNAAAILTALDDVQDAISTLACIGMVAAAVIGGPIAAAVLGPLGLILGASTLLNLLNPFSRLRKLGGGVGTGRAGKGRVEKQTNHNPFSKKAKVKLAARIKKFRPSTGNALEALQVTDNIFGVGVSIGPIMGFVQGAISGVIRSALGEKVTLAVGSPEPSKVNDAAAKALRATALLHGYAWHSDATDETMMIYAASLAMQALYPTLEEYNPFDEIEDLGDYLVECPQPTDVLTREILEEEGIDPDDACVWPQNGQRWISIAELQEATAEQAAANLRHYAEKNNHTLEAYNALTAADDFTLNFLAAVEGPDQIRVDYLRTERIVITILDNGWVYPDDITEIQIQKFEEWCYVHEYMDTQPTAKEIQHYADVFCGFTWQRSPEELR
ncbi:MAG: hypothetical protein RAO92_00700 [Candidatus Euphemobacter frigidus]|nr:hypothetical protein [Candidatus Euphemobacter frigidus]